MGVTNMVTSFDNALREQQGNDALSWMTSQSTSSPESAEPATTPPQHDPNDSSRSAPTDGPKAEGMALDLAEVSADPAAGVKMKPTLPGGNTNEGLQSSVAPKQMQRAMRDVGLGIVEAPRAILKGVREAGQAALDLAVDAGAWFMGDSDSAKLDDGAPDVSREELLPKIKMPESVTGQGITYLSQFVAGWYGAGKIMKGAGMLYEGTGFVTGMVRGAIADSVFWKKQETNLSNLIQDTPAANPVNAFLAAHPDDSEAWGRAKQAVEGLGLGTLTEGVLKAARAIQAQRVAAARTAALPEAVRPASTLPAGPGPLGDTTAELVVDGEKAAKQIQDDAAKGVKNDNVPPEDPALAKIKPGLKDALATGVMSTEDALHGVDQQVAAKGLTRVMSKDSGDVYVNFARIGGEDDIKSVIAQMASAIDNNPSAGKKTFKEIEGDAAAMDAWKALNDRPDKAPLGAAQSLAVRNLWYASGQKLFSAAEEAARNPSVENLYAFRRSMALHSAIQAQVLSIRTETARALGSWRIPADGSGKVNMKALTSAIDAMGGTEVNYDMAMRVSMLKNIGNLKGLDKIVEGGAMAKTHDTFLEIWRNGLLSTPATHVANISGNTLVAMMQVAERSVASRIGILGTGADNVVPGEAMAMIRGMGQGVMDGFRYAASLIKGGDTLGEGMGLPQVAGQMERQPYQKKIQAGTYGLRDDSWLGATTNYIGNIINIPGTALGVSDDFYKTLGYRMELHAQAWRQADAEVMAGRITKDQLPQYYANLIANPTEVMKGRAVDQAMYQTFTQAPGDFVKNVNAMRRNFPALNWVLPFVNTPANIFKYSMERTPLAPLMKQWRADVAEGGVKGQMALARTGLGIMTMMTGADLFNNGHLIGAGPQSTAERQTWLRGGNLPYSLIIGGRPYQFNRIEPFGSLLSIIADTAEFLHHGESNASWNPEQMVAATTFALAGSITNKTYFQGITNLVQAIADPDRYAPSFMQNFAGSFVPGGVFTARKIVDPYLRAASDSLDQIRSKIPGLSSDLPPRVDLWGRPITYESGFGKLYDAISPVRSTKGVQPEPIDVEIANQGWHFGPPSKTIKQDGKTVYLRNHPREYNRMLELAGQEITLPEFGNKNMLGYLNDLVEGKSPMSQAYQNMDPRAQEKFVRKAMTAYRKAAKEQLLREFPALMRGDVGPDGENLTGGD